MNPLCIVFPAQFSRGTVCQIRGPRCIERCSDDSCQSMPDKLCGNGKLTNYQVTGFVARMKALKKRPSTSGAIESASTP